MTIPRAENGNRGRHLARESSQNGTDNDPSRNTASRRDRQKGDVMSSYHRLDVTITSSKRTWCDVTVHRQGKPDLATRVRKVSAAGLPFGEKITVSGRVEWNKNRFGTTSELLIFSDDQVNKMKLEEAQQLIAKVRECATQRCYIPEKTVELRLTTCADIWRSRYGSGASATR